MKGQQVHGNRKGILINVGFKYDVLVVGIRLNLISRRDIFYLIKKIIFYFQLKSC